MDHISSMKLFVALLILTLSSIACDQGFSNFINDTSDTISDNGEELSIIKDYRKYVVDESTTSITQIKLNDSFDNPWAIEFLNDDLVVVTEKNGTLSLVNLQLGTVTPINHEIPSVQYGQGGLLDVLYHHRASVWGIKIQGNFLITGSMDKTISLINLETMQVEKHFIAHEDEWGGKSYSNYRERYTSSGNIFLV